MNALTDSETDSELETNNMNTLTPGLGLTSEESELIADHVLDAAAERLSACEQSPDCVGVGNPRSPGGVAWTRAAERAAALPAEDKQLVIKGLKVFTTIYLIFWIVYIIIFTWSIYLHVSCNNGISFGIIPAIIMPVFYIPYALAIC